VSERIDGLVFRYTFGRASRSAFALTRALLILAAVLLAAADLVDSSNRKLVVLATTAALVSVVVAAVLAVVGLLSKVWRAPERGALVVGDDRVAEFHSRGGARCVPVAAFVHGIALPTPNGWVVRLQAEDGDRHAITCPDAATADRVLAQLRLGVLDKRYGVEWGQGFVRLALAVALSTAATYAITLLGQNTIVSSHLAFDALPLVPIVVAWAVHTFGWRELDIGADGVVVEHIGFITRFLPYARIRDIRDRHHSIDFVLDDGETVSVWANTDDLELRRGVVRRIAQARAASLGEPSRAELVARCGRPVAAWRAALAAQLEQADGYRAAAVSADDATRLLADAGSMAEQRIAAAVALLATGGPASQTRVRVAAAACASPRMRIALERAADGCLNEALVDAAIDDDAPERNSYPRAREGGSS
jgi:hypothetical protein